MLKRTKKPPQKVAFIYLLFAIFNRVKARFIAFSALTISMPSWCFAFCKRSSARAFAFSARSTSIFSANSAACAKIVILLSAT